MDASTGMKISGWGKTVLTALLLLLGVNGAQVYTDPIGALTTEVQAVRKQIASIDGIADEVRAMRGDIDSIVARIDISESKLELIPVPKQKSR